MSEIPGYWPNETTGVLRPVVEKYLRGDALDPDEVATMRAYLRQWVAAPFAGPEIRPLRDDAERIRTHDDVREWLRRALDVGIDPL